MSGESGQKSQNHAKHHDHNVPNMLLLGRVQVPLTIRGHKPPALTDPPLFDLGEIRVE